MADKTPFQPQVIPFKGGRLAFAKIHKAEPRKLKPGQTPNPDAPKFYSAEILLDPTNIEQAKSIAAIKEDSVRALNHRFGTAENPAPFSVAILEQVAKGERSPPNFHLCWGYGDSLPAFGKKIYDGYKGMFYIRVKRTEKDGRPILLNRAGQPVVEGDKQCPYAGCVIGGTLNTWSYNNESKGVNANMRTLVFMADGKAFGGGHIDQEQEWAALGDLGNEVPAGDGGKAFDPFDI